MCFICHHIIVVLCSFRCEEFEISEEAKVCCALISAFESGDNSRFQQVLQQPILRSMDNVFLRLMKELRACSEISGVNDNGNSADDGENDCEDLK